MEANTDNNNPNAAGGAERERYGTGLKCPVCGFVGALKSSAANDPFPDRVVLGDGYVRIGSYSVELWTEPVGTVGRPVAIAAKHRTLSNGNAPRYRLVLERVRE